LGEQAVADVVKMVGVETRHWAAPDQTSADLCYVAPSACWNGWTGRRQRRRVDLRHPDPGPSAAGQRLPAARPPGLAPDCQAFDVNLGCSGYVYGLWLAASLIQSGCRRVLLLAGETSSRLVDPTDRGTAILFGDAGSASAIEHDPAAPAMNFRMGTDGSGAGALIVPQGGFRAVDPDRAFTLDPTRLHMDGGEVFTFTLRAVPKLVADTLADAGLAGEAVDAYLLHQANRFMLRHIGKKIGATDIERLPINIERYGNTSSATIPLLLADDMAQRLTTGSARLMLVGFGVGLSWGAVLAEFGPLACAEVIAA
jgi:3-oxoacyl-[acyl-carrier-protein] synthase-3